MNIEKVEEETGLEIVIKNLLEKHPVQMDMGAAAFYLDVGVGEAAARTARHRKTFPVKTQKINGRVVTAQLFLLFTRGR